METMDSVSMPGSAGCRYSAGISLYSAHTNTIIRGINTTVACPHKRCKGYSLMGTEHSAEAGAGGLDGKPTTFTYQYGNIKHQTSSYDQKAMLGGEGVLISCVDSRK